MTTLLLPIIFVAVNISDGSDSPEVDNVIDSIGAGSAGRAQIVWVKQHFTLSRGDYH